jgi:hypothetical protein
VIPDDTERDRREKDENLEKTQESPRAASSSAFCRILGTAQGLLHDHLAEAGPAGL